MLNDSLIEMEKAAKALDLSDINLAAVCLRKALEGHVEMAPPGPTPPANAVTPLAELAKSINALEIKEFHLSALCCDKAVHGLNGRLPEPILRSLHDAAESVRRQEFSSTANALREIIRSYNPELTLPAPQRTLDGHAMHPAVAMLDDQGDFDRPISELQPATISAPAPGPAPIEQPVVAEAPKTESEVVVERVMAQQTLMPRF